MVAPEVNDMGLATKGVKYINPYQKPRPPPERKEARGFHCERGGSQSERKGSGRLERGLNGRPDAGQLAAAAKRGLRMDGRMGAGIFSQR
jgi:hypothetical protein